MSQKIIFKNILVFKRYFVEISTTKVTRKKVELFFNWIINLHLKRFVLYWVMGSKCFISSKHVFRLESTRFSRNPELNNGSCEKFNKFLTTNKRPKEGQIFKYDVILVYVVFLLHQYGSGNAVIVVSLLHQYGSGNVAIATEYQLSNCGTRHLLLLVE